MTSIFTLKGDSLDPALLNETTILNLDQNGEGQVPISFYNDSISVRLGSKNLFFKVFFQPLTFTSTLLTGTVSSTKRSVTFALPPFEYANQNTSPTITYTFNENPSNRGSFNTSARTVTYQADNDFLSNDPSATLVFYATETSSSTQSTNNVSLQITNDSYEAGFETFTTSPSTSDNLTLLTGDVLSVNMMGPSNSTVTISNKSSGELIGTAVLDGTGNGSYVISSINPSKSQFSFVCQSSGGGTLLSDLNITATNVVFSGFPTTVVSSGIYTENVSFPSSYVIQAITAKSPAPVSFNSSSSTLTYTNSATYFDDDLTITIQRTGGILLKIPTRVSLKNNNTSVAIVFTNTQYTIVGTVGQTMTFLLSTNKTNATYAIPYTQSPTYGTSSVASNGTFTYVPSQSGTEIISLSATDPETNKVAYSLIVVSTVPKVGIWNANLSISSDPQVVTGFNVLYVSSLYTVTGFSDGGLSYDNVVSPDRIIWNPPTGMNSVMAYVYVVPFNGKNYGESVGNSPGGRIQVGSVIQQLVVGNQTLGAVQFSNNPFYFTLSGRSYINGVMSIVCIAT